MKVNPFPLRYTGGINCKKKKNLTALADRNVENKILT